MKKLALIIIVAGIVGMSSCSKDVVCTGTINGVGFNITLTDDNWKQCTTANSIETCTDGNYGENGSPADKDAAQKFSEDQGLTCK